MFKDYIINSEFDTGSRINRVAYSSSLLTEKMKTSQDALHAGNGIICEGLDFENQNPLFNFNIKNSSYSQHVNYPLMNIVDLK